MDGQDHRSADDDFTAEVSDLYPREDAAPRTIPRGLFEQRTRRQRGVRVGLALGAGLLLLAIIMGGSPGLRERALEMIPGLITTPTATLTPGDDLFYLLPNPPGVDVTVDGQHLTSLPLPGASHPLRLARGRHTFTWRSRTLPFAPLTCLVSVPRAAADTCPIVTHQALPATLADMAGSVIGMHESLREVDTDPAAARLPIAIQEALATEQSTATVQPGERYFVAQAGQSGTPVIATQPLRATRRVSFLPDSGYPEPCTLAQPAIPCRFAGQDCSQLCTITDPFPSVAGPPGTWLVAAMVSAEWDYQTLDGRVVALGVGEAFGVQLAVLRITWDGAGWYVTPIVGHRLGFDVADDAVCDPARFALANTSSWSFMMVNPPPGAQTQFVSDATPADGCVAVLTQGQPAIFLERFGVLLTVNDTAVNPSDNLPAANAAERQLAQHLMTSLSP
ncbi:MAG TPA: hypothetical protein VKQ30_18590 [Ktedonobacterales bacterium]|nr:hypothetical protein [Ktedonobacterales bacterium]